MVVSAAARLPMSRLSPEGIAPFSHVFELSCRGFWLGHAVMPMFCCINSSVLSDILLTGEVWAVWVCRGLETVRYRYIRSFGSS